MFKLLVYVLVLGFFLIFLNFFFNKDGQAAVSACCGLLALKCGTHLSNK